jgi:opine dehydrogenase
VVIPVVAWGTTVTTGRQPEPGVVDVSTVRKQIDVATVPAALAAQGLAICQELFGDRFKERESLLAIALSNLNPQNHMALALCNLTRMERGEEWAQMLYYTPAVGRLVEALDQERLAIAAACGVRVRDVFEHLHLSYHVPVGTVFEMTRSIHEAGMGGLGPRSLDTRYVLEDCPFGLVMTARLGRKVGQPALLHESGVRLLSALYGTDFARQNDLLDSIEFDRVTPDELKEISRAGYPPREVMSEGEVG